MFERNPFSTSRSQHNQELFNSLIKAYFDKVQNSDTTTLQDYTWELNKQNLIELTLTQRDYLIRVKNSLKKSLDFPLQLTQCQFIDHILDNNSYKEEDRPRLNKLKEYIQ